MSKYSTKEFLKMCEDSSMPISTKLIRDSLLAGTYVRRRTINEAPVKIVSMDLVKEKYGYGVSVKIEPEHEYRYAADDSHAKYDTPEKLLAGAKKLLKFRGSGATLGWLDRNGILYYGSKRGANRDFPKESVETGAVSTQTEEVSAEVYKELIDIIKQTHKEYSREECHEAAEAFLEDFNITNDKDYYRLGPNKLRKALL